MKFTNNQQLNHLLDNTLYIWRGGGGKANLMSILYD